MKCPKCQKEIEFFPGETVFCPECGCNLKEIEEKKSVPEKEPFPTHRGVRASCNEVSSEAAFSAGTDCKCLQVKFNKNVYLMNNSVSPLQLELTPLKKELKSVTILMAYIDSSGHKTFQPIPIMKQLLLRKTLQISTNYAPQGITGQVMLDFYVGCHLEHEVNYYMFSTTLPVYDREGSRDESKQVIMINAHDAADVNLYGDVKARSGKNVNDMIKGLDEKKVCFELQDLVRIDRDPIVEKMIEERGIYPEITDKLLLKWKDYKIFLLASKDIRVGRVADHCDLVVRKKGVPMDEKPNRTVSRVHGIISYWGDQVVFEDKSTYGSWINNQQVEEKTFLPEYGIIEFGDIHWKMNLQYCNGASAHPMCGFCPRKKIKSLTFERCDEDKELYFFVWQGCDLGKALPGLMGWKVFYRDNTFLISAPNEETAFLKPGIPFESNGERIEVNFFSQL